MSLRDVMTADVLTTSVDETIAVAARSMTDRGIGSACVVDDDGSLIGIITERDVLRAAAAAVDVTAEPVRAWMTSDPITVGPDELPSRVTATMREQAFRHLPVCEEGELIGIVSLRDLWKFSFLPEEPDDMTMRH